MRQKVKISINNLLKTINCIICLRKSWFRKNKSNKRKAQRTKTAPKKISIASRKSIKWTIKTPRVLIIVPISFKYFTSIVPPCVSFFLKKLILLPEQAFYLVGNIDEATALYFHSSSLFQYFFLCSIIVFHLYSSSLLNFYVIDILHSKKNELYNYVMFLIMKSFRLCMSIHRNFWHNLKILLSLSLIEFFHIFYFFFSLSLIREIITILISETPISVTNYYNLR